MELEAIRGQRRPKGRERAPTLCPIEDAAGFGFVFGLGFELRIPRVAVGVGVGVAVVDEKVGAGGGGAAVGVGEIAGVLPAVFAAHLPLAEQEMAL